MFVWANTSDAIATQAIAIIFDFIYFPFVSLEFIFDTRGGSCSDVQKRDYQGITFRSRKNLPVSFCGASVASQGMPAAPSPIERGGIRSAHVGAIVHRLHGFSQILISPALSWL